MTKTRGSARPFVAAEGRGDRFGGAETREFREIITDVGGAAHRSRSRYAWT